MAVKYRDGWGVHALNGVRVPEWIVMTPAEKIDCHEFSKISNAEVRREFVRKVGVERLMVKLGSKMLDKQGDYELHSIPLGGRTGDWPYLKMLNPSIGVWHVEAVSKKCDTVEKALNFRNQGKVEFLAPIS
jgi:hypothetical protein